MLVPGVRGLSDKIEVRSIVGRFLEHSRICYFYNSGNDEIYLSSADWMPRNLERRVELMFPVEQADLKERLTRDLQTFFKDNTQAHELQEDGGYRRLAPRASEKPFQCQEFFYREAQKRARTGRMSPRREFTVRRRGRRAGPEPTA
jgi:polyphosphate kinase